MVNSSSLSTEALEAAILTNLTLRTLYRGEILLPCLPSALGAYLRHVAQLFRLLGRPLGEAEREQFIQLLRQTLTQGYEQSPNAQLVLTYEVRGTSGLAKDLACDVALVLPSLMDTYQHWTQQDANALFGQHPDAMVMAVVKTLPPGSPVLDVGAGYGRNAVAIAQQGHPVDALDLTSELIADLHRTVNSLPIQTRVGDVLDPELSLPINHYQLVILSEVTSHFRSPAQLQQMFDRVCACLRPGGMLLLNCFLADPDYVPTSLGVEMSQVAWSSLFTWAEVEAAYQGLPLQLVEQTPVLAYEQAHLPAEAWPPTPWYEDWASGRSIFPFLETAPPVSFQWLRWEKCLGSEQR
jgi:SAM-dependent methyltransferase